MENAFPLVYGAYLQSHELAIPAEATLRWKPDPAIYLIAHFDDGSILTFPDGKVDIYMKDK